MAATVLSGTGNVTYTNNTGQNVRVVINFYRCNGDLNNSATTIITWAGNSIAEDRVQAFGRNLAFSNGSTTISNNMNPAGGDSSFPTEIMLAAGQTFSISTNLSIYPLGAYNIVVIPEAG